MKPHNNELCELVQEFERTFWFGQKTYTRNEVRCLFEHIKKLEEQIDEYQGQTHDDIYSDGYDQGHADGVREAEESYDEGWYDGYEKGYKAAKLGLYYNPRKHRYDYDMALEKLNVLDYVEKKPSSNFANIEEKKS